MNLYAIDGAVNEQRKRVLKDILDQAAKENSNRLQDELHKLYKQKIIMIGFCSC